MAITQREAFAQVMEHLVTHDGDRGHGYSQYTNEVLHSDLAHSQARSQGMAAKVDHICDRVDLMYDRGRATRNGERHE